MVGLIVDLVPENIKKIKLKLQKEQSRANHKLLVSRALERGIMENPIKRNKFQID